MVTAGQHNEGQPIEVTDDDVVIDITDAAMARQALYDRLVSSSPSGELVIDLRDDVLDAIAELAPTGRTLESGPSVSGRPPELLDGHELLVISGGDRWMDAEAFVYDCYVKLGYTSESSRKQVEELVRFAEHSRFHAVVNEHGHIIGTTRVIFGTFDTLPVGKFTRIDFFDEEPMAELSSIVVDPSVRSTGVIEHLYRSGWADAITNGARTITGLGERWMLDTFRRSYALPFVPCGVPEYYMGGDVIPMTMSVRPNIMRETARCNPQFWLWAVERLTPEQIEELGYGETIEVSRQLVAEATRPAAT